MTNLTDVDMEQLKMSNPTWMLKNVMAEIIKNYPAEMPTDILQQMVNHIIGGWEALEKMAAKSKRLRGKA